MLHLSTPSSKIKSKSLTTVGDVLVCNPEPYSQSPPFTKLIQTNISNMDMTTAETASGFGDVTFKSLICPGGEVQITGASVCTEESIILPKNQAMINTNETEDSVISDSMIVQSCCDHIEHPYHNPARKHASLVDTHTQDVTLKFFVCDGAEVEVSDITRLQDETIPLPKAQLGEHLEDNGVNSTNLLDCSQIRQVEHADHPYCSSQNGVCVNASPANGLSDVTFKSLNCTGGEIQISDGTRLADETVPLPADQTVACSESTNGGIDSSILAVYQDVQNGEDHLDHPYCNVEIYQSTPSGNFNITQEQLPFNLDAVEEVKQISLVVPDGPTDTQRGLTVNSLLSARGEGEDSDGARLSLKTYNLPDDQAVINQTLNDNGVNTSFTQDQIQHDYEQTNSHTENSKIVVDSDPPAVTTSSLTNASLKSLGDKSVHSQMQEPSEYDLIHPEDSALPSVSHKARSSECSHLAASATAPVPVAVHQEPVSDVHLSRGPHESSEAKDSALGSYGNEPVLCDSADIAPHPESLPEVLKVLSRCPSVASALQFGLLSPVVRRASLYLLGSNKDPAADPFLADDSALEDEKSFLAPVKVNPAGLWADHLESPMPRPLFNSTALGRKAQPGPVTEADVDVNPFAVPQPEVEKPVLDVPSVPDGPLQQQLRQMAEFLLLVTGKMDPAAVSAPIPPSSAVPVPSAKATPTESHSVCVGTSPMKLVDHSVNTSGQFERRRVFSVVDSCTLTDPLLWNVPPGSLESLPRQELEQRLRSSMIMVEALVQQLTAARTHGCPAGPAPSDLREKLVQTDHTELSQVTSQLNLPQTLITDECLSLSQQMSLSCDTDTALSNMKQIGEDVKVDHQSLVSHAFSAMEQLRTHCATEISQLERIVGSQEELFAALNQTYPELVIEDRLKTKHLFSIHSTNDNIFGVHVVIFSQLCTVRGLLQKTVPILLKLNQKAAAALTERDEHITARDQAIEEREQTNLDLQTAREQIGDLNLQVTILTSEMGVLRQKLTERDEERGQLERKATELSATVSSTLASYTFLEQALAAETTKLQQSRKDIQQAKDRANEKLGPTQMAFTDQMILSQLCPPILPHNPAVIATAPDLVKSFLQMENELAREQMSESERMLSSNLQGLRERNIQCEDLKGELNKLQLENRSLKEELETTKFKASATELELGDKLAQTGTEITLLHHTLRGLTNELHTALNDQVEQQAANNRHQSEVLELKNQLSRLNSLAERGNQALQQKAQELRKEVIELRRSLQQSMAESQFLREELRKAAGQSAPPAHFMEEKIRLLKEVSVFTMLLCLTQQIIHQNNQQKSENELQMLNHMINKVRETLLSLPDVVKNSEQLQQLVEYIG
uniref:Uncharacterized LOC115592271 n=1 Tax=Sparus aurata TaxID=8175 RepID=A0A671WN76_SPAAU